MTCCFYIALLLCRFFKAILLFLILKLKVNCFKIVIMTTAKLAMHLHLLQLLFVPYDYFHILMILLLMGFTENEKNYNHPPMKTTFTQCINSY
jgi:hypothetical protein